MIKIDRRTQQLLFYFQVDVLETGRIHIIFDGYDALVIEVVDQSSPHHPDDGQDDEDYERLDTGTIVLSTSTVFSPLQFPRALAILSSWLENLSRVSPVTSAAVPSNPFTQQAI